jgi:phosphopantothenoylcysteine decarboxylase/phosphopantothenate--cysteine ligase
LETIVLGITGSIAAYKAAEIIRGLSNKGIGVNCVVTAGAKEFITPLTLRTLSNNPVYDDMFYEGKHSGSPVTHIGLAQNCALVLVAPATANVIGKIAAGIADDLLTTVVMAAAPCKKVLIAPAMNDKMWANPLVQDNVEKLKKLGYIFIGPGKGALACGDTGEGRMEDTQEIVETVVKSLKKKSLEGKTVLVTSGATREFIDDVRFISNPSSGKTGFFLAREAKARGARVIFITGKTSFVPEADEIIETVSAADMLEAVRKNHNKADIIIGAAAVGDFMVKKQKGKLERRNGMTLELEPTKDILADISGENKGRIVVGFSAEAGNGAARSAEKIRKKKLDMIVWNDITKKGAGFDSDTNEIRIISRDGRIIFRGKGTKQALASVIFDAIEKI